MESSGLVRTGPIALETESTFLFRKNTKSTFDLTQLFKWDQKAKSTNKMFPGIIGSLKPNGSLPSKGSTARETIYLIGLNSRRTK